MRGPRFRSGRKRSKGRAPPQRASEVRGSLCEVGEIKRTFQPKKRHRGRVHGFLVRMRKPGGRRVVRNRRRKGRHQLAQ